MLLVEYIRMTEYNTQQSQLSKVLHTIKQCIVLNKILVSTTTTTTKPLIPNKLG
uniref:Uncharacterized protein n=1 Tax=Arundo donax TaxID=35708 RepID=A0A0A9GL62_ARUDO